MSRPIEAAAPHGALAGLRVIECARGIAGPYAAMLLAEQGAEVLKIEPPSGDPARRLPGFHVWNRSKRKTIIDLRTVSGCGHLRRLCAVADVLISDWSPPALPVTYNELAADNPRLVHCWMPPAGSQGEMAGGAANDDLVAARGGLLATQWARREGPVFLTVPVASYGAAMLAAGAVCAALLARERTGVGQQVEVSLLAGAMAMQTGTLLMHPAVQRVMGVWRDPQGSIPVYRLYEARDGWLFIACATPTFWHKLCLAIGRPELVSDPRFEAAPWGIPAEHGLELKTMLRSVIYQRSRDEWLRIFAEADVPSAPVLSRADFIDDAQIQHLQMAQRIVDPILGRTLQMGVPVNLRGTPGGIRGPAPALTDSEPESVGMWERGGEASVRNAARVPAAAPAAGGALGGRLVLELGGYIAGPLAATALAWAGADVIKIETPQGDPFRAFGFGFYGWNQSKRGLALDLTKPGAREVLADLARKADVLVENMRPGATRRLGIDYDTVSQLNPRLVYASITAFGASGPRGREMGFDPLLQARSGIMAAQGGHGGAPIFFACGVADYSAAFLAAFGVTAALLARERTGLGQLVETSLAQAAMAVQSGEFIFYDGRPDMENGGADLLGRHPLRRAYRCRDGWIFVSAEAGSWCRTTPGGEVTQLEQALRALPDFAQLTREPVEGADAERLASLFAERLRHEVLAELSTLGITAAPVRSIEEIFQDDGIAANRLLTTSAAPPWGEFRQTGELVKYRDTPAPVRTGPQLGQHTEEILRAVLGYPPEQIQRLQAAGAVRIE